MVAPATYYGYDENQNCIVTGNAEDATAYLNPQQVQKAIEKVQKVMEEQMSEIVRALMQVSDDASDAVIIQGTKMSGVVDDMAEVISNLPAQLLNGYDQLYATALANKDKIQENLNANAYNAVLATNGVVSIR